MIAQAAHRAAPGTPCRAPAEPRRATADAGRRDRRRGERRPRCAALERRRAAAACRAARSAAHATQAVFGEGPVDAAADVRRRAARRPGRPARPAVRRPCRAAARPGARRSSACRATQVYVTNAVKHFKFELRGKRRIHKTPAQQEAAACLDWLEREIALVRPRAIVALGATAARSLLGRPVAVTRERGRGSARRRPAGAGRRCTRRRCCGFRPTNRDAARGGCRPGVARRSSGLPAGGGSGDVGGTFPRERRSKEAWTSPTANAEPAPGPRGTAKRKSRRIDPEIRFQTGARSPFRSISRLLLRFCRGTPVASHVRPLGAPAPWASGRQTIPGTSRMTTKKTSAAALLIDKAAAVRVEAPRAVKGAKPVKATAARPRPGPRRGQAQGTPRQGGQGGKGRP